MIRYRTFRNTDPPQLLRLWHECGLGRGAALGFTKDALELLVFGQPYFDPRGLVVALSGDRIVGFAHTGFGANDSETGLDLASGAICAVLVHPEFRRQGIGRELVARSEAYLQAHGTSDVHAGPCEPRDPFYLGLYGGSQLPGFLESDPAAAPFFTALGYQPIARRLVFQRDLTDKSEPVDYRLVQIRRSTQLGITPNPERLTWWWAARYGRLDSLRFLLLNKRTGTPHATVSCSGLDLYIPRWQQRAVGLRTLQVAPADEGKGYAEVLLLEACRRLRQETVTLVEMHVPENNTAGVARLQFLGFQQVDTGIVYRKSVSAGS